MKNKLIKYISNNKLNVNCFGRDLEINGYKNVDGEILFLTNDKSCGYITNIELPNLKPYLYSIDCLLKEIDYKGNKIIPMMELLKVAETEHYNYNIEYEYLKLRENKELGIYSVVWIKDNETFLFSYHVKYKSFTLISDNKERQLIINNQAKLFDMLYDFGIWIYKHNKNIIFKDK